MNYILATKQLHSFLTDEAITDKILYSALYCKYYRKVHEFVTQSGENKLKKFVKKQKYFAKMLPLIAECPHNYAEQVLILYGKYSVLPELSEQYCDLLLAKYVFNDESDTNRFFAINIMEYIDKHFRNTYSGSEFIDELFLVPKKYDIELIHEYVKRLAINRICRFRINSFVANPPIGDKIVHELVLYDDCFVFDEHNYKLLPNGHNRTSFLNCGCRFWLRSN
jgi:hypothetical protein